jgi:lipopolysaccharide biosynthesis regulator YciM
LLRRNLDEEQRNAVLGELAADFRQGGFVQRAIASYQEVLARDPRDLTALRALSELLADVRDYPQALEVFRRLGKVEKRKDPEGEARLLTQMAESAHAAGDHDLARKSVKRALRRHASYAEARILQGELEAERGRDKAALAAWRLVLEAGGEPAVELHARVEASFAALGRLEDYERFLRGLLEERPGDAAARMALAGALGTRGEFSAAVLELRRVLDVDPQNLAARIALGRLLIAESRDADAIKEYRELLEWLDRRAVRISQLRELDGLPTGRLDR